MCTFVSKFKNLLAIVAFSAFIFPVNHVLASASYEVVFKVVDENSADIRVTYDVLDNQKFVTALSTHLDGNMREGYRDLISAYADDGTAREITHNNSVEDAQVAIKQGDKKITVQYKLLNSAKSRDISLFNFLLFFGNEYPRQANIKISGSNDYEILNFSGFENSVKQADGSYLTNIGTNMPESRLSAKGMYVLIYPRSKSAFVQKSINNFYVYGLPGNVEKVIASIKKIGDLSGALKKVLGDNMPSKISIVVSKIFSNNNSYETVGNALGDNVIFIDPEGMLNSNGPNDLEKIITHETAHLMVAKSQIFDGQVYIARWLNEGLAVFAEQYITDQYLVKDDDSRNIDSTLSKYIKLNKAELKSEYSKQFDYQIADGKSIDKIYAHSGLIFYNLFLRDASIIPKLLNSLRNKESKPLCADCDTKTVLDEIKKISGLPESSIIYPYKDDFSNKNLDKLTVGEVSQELKQKIKSDRLKTLTNYVNKDSKVEDFIAPATSAKENTVKSADVNIKPTGDKIKIDTDAQNNQVKVINEDKKDLVLDEGLSNRVTAEDPGDLSFFGKIKKWFSGLFK